MQQCGGMKGEQTLPGFERGSYRRDLEFADDKGLLLRVLRRWRLGLEIQRLFAERQMFSSRDVIKEARKGVTLYKQHLFF